MRKWLVQIRGSESQQKVADRIGIAQSTYASIEVGVRKPSVTMAKRIADVMGFDWTKFFEEETQIDAEQVFGLIDRIFYAAFDAEGNPAEGYRLSDLFDVEGMTEAELTVQSAVTIEDEKKFGRAIVDLERIAFAEGFKMGTRLARELEEDDGEA